MPNLWGFNETIKKTTENINYLPIISKIMNTL
ncbi:hypothetical protein RCH19_000376 [Flavobacterium sp. PL12]